jgi:putative methylase
MRPKHLAMALSKLQPHPSNDVALEQYATEGDLAAYWMLAVDELDGLENAVVADLGAGNGILGIACLMLGAKHVHFYECDDSVLEVLRSNLERLPDDLQGRSTVHAQAVDGTSLEVPGLDAVVMNPPWGVQRPKADRPFLLTGFSSGAKAVHLLHSDKAAHVEGVATEHGWEAESVLRTDFRLPATYHHHAQRTGSTEVRCWRFHRPGDARLPTDEG